MQRHHTRSPGSRFAIPLSIVLVGAGCGGARVTDPTETQQSALSIANTASLQLQVLTNSCGANQMQDFFRVTNTGTTPIKLADISVKFWADDTSGKALVPHVWTGGCVTGVGGNPSCVHQVAGVTAAAATFSPACGPDATHQANWEITITDTDTTTLAPGAVWDNIQSAVNEADFSNFTPGTSSWFSPCLTGTTYATDPHFAVYYQGNLVVTNGITAPSCRGPHGAQQLSGYLGNTSGSLFPVVGPVPPNTVLSLSIGLPVSDPAGLQAFIDQASNPTSPTYRQYLTPATFKTRFGALDSDYANLQAWAQGVGLTVTQTYSNNLLLTVSGTAAQIERALFVNLVYRQRFDSNSQFVAVDREPSIDPPAPTLLWISGFTDYVTPHSAGCTPNMPALGGVSGTGFQAADLRNAYLGPGSTCQSLDGSNQTVGVFELEPFTPSDISSYIAAQTTGIPNVTPQIVAVSDAGNTQTGEAAMDIEGVLAMAPKATVVVFQGNTGITAHADDILHKMATDGRLTVATNSWFFGQSSNQAQAIAQMAAQGVTFFTASGDYGNIGDPQNIDDIPNQTLVGGTFLNTGAVGSTPYYLSEGTWNQGCPGITPVLGGFTKQSQDITSGGVMDGNALLGCQCFPEPFCCGSATDIPGYQDPGLMTPIAGGGNGGSKQFRNYPDVAAVAYKVGQFYNGGFGTFTGTSDAAPIWAGFTALANQFASSNGVGNVGFANPVIYGIGATRGLPGGADIYTSSFHDINDLVNNSATPGVPGFPSVTGYDLATGWGSPQCGLIQQLGSFNPVAPQSYDQIEIHLASGHDGVNDQSSVLLDLVGAGGTLLQELTLKAQGETGWSDIGSEHDILRTLDNPLRPEDVLDLQLKLLQNGQGGVSADNWDVSGIGVRLVGVHVPAACLIDMSGNEICDAQQPSCMNGKLEDGHPGVVRLSENPDQSGQGGEAFFDPDPSSFTNSGCPKWGGPASSEPLTHLEFTFDTGDDDFRSDSELDVDVFDFSGNNVEHGVVHAVNDTIFDNDTEHKILYALHSSLSISNIKSVQLTFIPATITCFLGICSHDEWHAQAIEIYGVRAASNWEHTCLFVGQEAGTSTPEFNFNNDNRVQSLGAGSGCI
jgi:hypothetical protein